jgi:hypothetical protein
MVPPHVIGEELRTLNVEDFMRMIRHQGEGLNGGAGLILWGFQVCVKQEEISLFMFIPT